MEIFAAIATSLNSHFGGHASNSSYPTVDGGVGEDNGRPAVQEQSAPGRQTKNSTILPWKNDAPGHDPGTTSSSSSAVTGIDVDGKQNKSSKRTKKRLKRQRHNKNRRRRQRQEEYQQHHNSRHKPRLAKTTV